MKIINQAMKGLRNRRDVCESVCDSDETFLFSVVRKSEDCLARKVRDGNDKIVMMLLKVPNSPFQT